MTIFRKHKGSFQESLDTSIKINNVEDIIHYLKEDIENNKLNISVKDIKISEYGYDSRIGKNLFIVTFFNVENGQNGILGFLES